jgi:PAB1-binding protein PBP1
MPACQAAGAAPSQPAQVGSDLASEAVTPAAGVTGPKGGDEASDSAPVTVMADRKGRTAGAFGEDDPALRAAIDSGLFSRDAEVED